MSRRRVVITGLGCATSLGHDVEQVFADLMAGKSGIKTLTRFDVSEYATKFGGEIPDWKPRHLDHRVAKRMDRFAQFGMEAGIDAASDAGIDFSKEDADRAGSIIGSGVGGIEEFAEGHQKLLEKGPDRVSPFMVPKLMCNACSGNLAIHYAIHGPNSATATACASAGHAIGEAMQSIRHNEADIMFAGGSEAALTPLGVACFIALKALSRRNDEPEKASRPFDKDRDGFILSEGAGVILLEEYEHANKRGAKIYAELVGYGQSADGTHITAPDEQGRGAAHAMRLALADAGLSPEAVQYINAHGTSTPLGDIAETRAIKLLFGDHAKKLAVSSTKSMTGHLLGASGGLESVICAKAIDQGRLPPTINLDEPGEECDLDYIPNTGREVDVRVAMNNTFGFGGHNVSLVMRKL